MTRKIRIYLEIALVILAILLTIYNSFYGNSLRVFASIVGVVGTIIILISDLIKRK